MKTAPHLDGLYLVLSHGWAIRLSTVVMLTAIIAAGFFRRERKWAAIVVAGAFFFGFDVAWQLTALGVAVAHSAHPLTSLARLPGLIPAYDTWLLLALPCAVGFGFAADRLGVRPPWWGIAAVGVLWLAWLATGFHYNSWGDARVDVLDEVLNESAKTAWGLAYLIPLLRSDVFHQDERWKSRARIDAQVAGAAAPRHG